MSEHMTGPSFSASISIFSCANKCTAQSLIMDSSSSTAIEKKTEKQL